MAIPVILKGDTSAEIVLSIGEGFPVSECTLLADFCGIRREFHDVVSGGNVTLAFSADETANFPLGTSKVMFSLRNAAGEVCTFPWAKIKVTDCPADVYDAAITIDPATLEVEALPPRFNDEDVRERLNAVINWMKRTASVVALLALPAFGDILTVQTAPKGTTYNDERVVTNVTFDAAGFTNDVCNIVTNVSRDWLCELGTLGKAPSGPYWTGRLYNSDGISSCRCVLDYNSSAMKWHLYDDAEGGVINQQTRGREDSTRLVFEFADDSTAATVLGTNKIVLVRTGLLSDFLRLEDLPPLTNYATRAELDTGWWSEWAIPTGLSSVVGLKWEREGWCPVGRDGYACGVHQGDENSDCLTWDSSISADAFTATRHRVAAPVPMKMSDLTNDTGYLTAEYDPTVSAWAKAESKPTYNAGEVGAYSAADGTNLANVVNLWEGYWDGTNVIFEVTNYYGNTSGELPRLRIKEMREGVWHTVWDEANKFAVCETQIVAIVSASNAACRAGCAADLATGLAGRAPLAWGTVTDKGTTNVVGNSVWMTAPETYFAGGTEYQRVAVGSGLICVLTDNGALSKTTGEPGTFRFQDEGGTNYFGFAKSDSYTIGCNTDGITVEGTLVTLRYDVIMGGGDVPIVYWRQSLTSGEWTQLNNADGTAAQGAPYTVTWYTSGGSYYAAINCGENASGFFKAETSVAGDVVFETNMKMRIDGGLECPNTATGVMGVVRPSYNGSTVIWTWSAK